MNIKHISVRLLMVALIAAIATSAYTARADDDNRRRKIVESWRLFDQMGMMQQLGLIPTPG